MSASNKEMEVIRHNYVTAETNISIDASFSVFRNRAMNNLVRQDLLPARIADRYEVQRRIVPLENPLKAWGLA
ncbi:MAG TPA: hypothetical protein VEX43_19155 [Chthoniobacterales bacterium]|nr:hypothetical protein [Chthoniobacterales bacterium]